MIEKKAEWIIDLGHHHGEFKKSPRNSHAANPVQKQEILFASMLFDSFLLFSYCVLNLKWPNHWTKFGQ